MGARRLQLHRGIGVRTRCFADEYMRNNVSCHLVGVGLGGELVHACWNLMRSTQAVVVPDYLPSVARTTYESEQRWKRCCGMMGAWKARSGIGKEYDRIGK